MCTQYVAYGLSLRSAFRLPGMIGAHQAGLPSLRLDLVTPGELEGAWSGCEGEPTWTGLLGDGRGLTIEHGVSGEVRFTYGGADRFLLDPPRRALLCAPRSTGRGWQRALLTKVLANVSLICGYEALHASAVESPHGTVVVLARSGAGKTTLAIELMRRGWPLVADDVLALRSRGGAVLAFPATPHINLPDEQPETSAAELGETLGVLSDGRWLAVEAVARQPQRVCMICLLERSPAVDLEAEVLAPSPLALAPYMLGLPADDERARGRFDLYANLMDSAALLRIEYGTAARPSQVAELIEKHVAAHSPVLAPGGAL
jgi:hypothetical protein